MKRIITKVIYALAALSLACAPALAAMPKPGETPAPATTPAAQAGSYQISMASTLAFAHPGAAAQAGIVNPEGSGSVMRYTLLLAPDELERVSAVAGEGQSEIALFRSEPVRPGESLPTIRLETLPDGSMLREGAYKAHMLVEPFDAATGEPSTNVFRLENTIQVMADEREATAAQDGALDLLAHNSANAVTRYALLLSARELREAAGVALYQGGKLSEKDTMIELWVSGEIGAHETLIEAPVVRGLPAGNYCAYLVRLVGGKQPYGCSRVKLRVDALCGEVISSIPELGEERAIAYAQAVVNCEYLLSLDNPSN